MLNNMPLGTKFRASGLSCASRLMVGCVALMLSMWPVLAAAFGEIEQLPGVVILPNLDAVSVPVIIPSPDPVPVVPVTITPPTTPVPVKATPDPNLKSEFDHLTTGFPLLGRHQLITCESCHRDGIFKGLPSRCGNCHDGKFARGTHVNHIITIEQCNTCHNPRGFNLSAVMDHSTTTAPCFSCHTGTMATGKSSDHVPTSNNCAACHVTASWTLIRAFDHSEIDQSTNCFSCHNGGSATGKSATHIASTNNCSVCHTVAGWKPWVHGASSSHHLKTHEALLSGTCAQCHSRKGLQASIAIAGVVADGQSPDHIPTNAPCDLCHTINGWFPATFTHAKLGIVGNCVQCHVSGIKATSKSAGHPLTTAVCEGCHVTSSWIVTKVDHAQASGQCGRCHDGVIAKGKIAKPDHVITTSDCGVCHKVTGWFPAIGVDHSTINSNCISCHDGFKAGGMLGKHSKGMSTTNRCENCHNKQPSPWSALIRPVDHTQMLGSCGSCHDGVLATGKNKIANHIATTADCGACHKVTAWFPASGTDHSNITRNCFTCHNGTNAKGKEGKHTIGLATTNKCEACHDKLPWPWDAILQVDHSQVTAPTCFDCHNGQIALGWRGKHDRGLVTSRDCSACHFVGPLLWAPVKIFNHNDAVVTGQRCFTCHNGTLARGKSGGVGHPNTTNICAACHSTLIWTSVLSVDHREVLGTCASAGCHAKDFPPQHMPISVPYRCELCHLPAPSRWSPPFTVDHNQIGGRACVTCHKSGSFAQGIGGKHLSGMATSDRCDACHFVAPQAFSPFKTFLHTETRAQCGTCHNNSLFIGKGFNHLTSVETCQSCHNSTSTWADGAYDHAFFLGTCTHCHNGSTRGTAIPPDHCPITTDCNTCHMVPPASWADTIGEC